MPRSPSTPRPPRSSATGSASARRSWSSCGPRPRRSTHAGPGPVVARALRSLGRRRRRERRCGAGTFGASPGDDAHDEPYLYVTHWADVPPDPFWDDDAFAGASLPLSVLVAPRTSSRPRSRSSGAGARCSAAGPPDRAGRRGHPRDRDRRRPPAGLRRSATLGVSLLALTAALLVLPIAIVVLWAFGALGGTFGTGAGIVAWSAVVSAAIGVTFGLGVLSRGPWRVPNGTRSSSCPRPGRCRERRARARWPRARRARAGAAGRRHHRDRRRRAPAPGRGRRRRRPQLPHRRPPARRPRGSW